MHKCGIRLGVVTLDVPERERGIDFKHENATVVRYSPKIVTAANAVRIEEADVQIRSPQGTAAAQAPQGPQERDRRSTFKNAVPGPVWQLNQGSE